MIFDKKETTCKHNWDTFTVLSLIYIEKLIAFIKAVCCQRKRFFFPSSMAFIYLLSEIPVILLVTLLVYMNYVLEKPLLYIKWGCQMMTVIANVTDYLIKSHKSNPFNVAHLTLTVQILFDLNLKWKASGSYIQEKSDVTEMTNWIKPTNTIKNATGNNWCRGQSIKTSKTFSSAWKKILICFCHLSAKLLWVWS